MVTIHPLGMQEEAPWPLAVPAAHATQAALDALPVLGLNVPAAQGVGFTEESGQNEPAGQSAGTPEEQK